MSEEIKKYRIFCDESCHLERDGFSHMALGGISIDESIYLDVNQQIKAIKNKHKFNVEIKWTKVSAARLDFYRELLDLIFDNPLIRFRVVVVDKSELNHDLYNNGGHNQFYYKMFYYVLNHFLDAQCQYRVFLDYKDTKSEQNLHALKDRLQSKCGDTLDIRLQNIRSHESLLMQVVDLVIGAITYKNRELNTSTSKVALIEHIEKRIGQSLLTQSGLFNKQFNIFIPRLRS